MKVSPGGSFPGREGKRAGSKGSELGYVILCFRVSTTSFGARSEGRLQLASLTPSLLPLLPLLPACSPRPLSIPGSLQYSWSLRKSPACSPHSQLALLAPLAPSLLPLLPLLPACSPQPLSILGSLEPSWNLRKPPAHSPCSQLALLTSSSLLLLPLRPLAPSLLHSLPAHSPCSNMPPCFQLAPLTPSLLPLLLMGKGG